MSVQRSRVAFGVLLSLGLVFYTTHCAQSQRASCTLSDQAREQKSKKLFGQIYRALCGDQFVTAGFIKQCLKEGATFEFYLTDKTYAHMPFSYWLLRHSRKDDVIKVCVENGMRLDTPWNNFPTPFHYAASCGKWQLARYLINDTMANIPDSVGITPLLLAAVGCHDQSVRDNIVQRLLNAGAQPNATDYQCGISALWCAALFWDATTAAILIKHGADKNVQSKYESCTLKKAMLLSPARYYMGDDQQLTKQLQKLIQARRNNTNDSTERYTLMQSYLQTSATQLSCDYMHPQAPKK